MKLGINIDHIATIRNARGYSDSDSLIRAAKICKKNKVDILTVHLREDRRHIKDNDLIALKKISKIPINLEMALTQEMIDIVKKIKPSYICLVPEKRKEITTEGGVNIRKLSKKLFKSLYDVCLKYNISLSAFVDPNKEQILMAKKYGFDTVEIHTGSLENKKVSKKEIQKITNSIQFAYNLNLIVNAGHGLNFHNIKYLKDKKLINTIHIGHFIIFESIFTSLDKVIAKFKRITR
jgi:pyridoxine 5-phosphate synthase